MNISKHLSFCSILASLFLFAPLSSFALENIAFSRMILGKDLTKVKIATPDTKGHLLVLTKGKNAVLVLDHSGNIVSSFGIGIDGRKKSGLRNPSDIEIGSEGKIYISDTGNDRVVIYDKDYRYFSEMGERGSKRGQLHKPLGIKIDTSGNIYVADSGNDRVQVFNQQGMPIILFEGSEVSVARAGYPRYQGETGYPLPNILSSMPILQNPYEDPRKQRRQHSESSHQRSSDELQLNNPSDIAFDNEGNVYVADTGNGRVMVFTKNGIVSHVIGSAGGKQKEFRRPVSLLIDPKSRLYICDAGNSKIGIFNLNMKTYQEIGIHGKKRGGEFNVPTSISLDNAGNLYVADSQNNRVQVFSVGAPVIAKNEQNRKKTVVYAEDIPVSVLTFHGVSSNSSLQAEMLTDLLKTKLAKTDNVRLIDSQGFSTLEPNEKTFQEFKNRGALFAVFGQVSESGAFTEIYLKIFNTRSGLNEITPQIIKVANADYREFIQTVVSELKEVYSGHYLPPEAPTGFMAHGGDRSVSLSWEKSLGTEVQQFNVYRSLYPDTGFKKIHESHEESYTDSGLEYGETLYYRITSVNLEGIEGKPSTIATAATFPAPLPVRSLKATPLAKAAKITWKKAPEIDPSGFKNIGYRVYRSSEKSNNFKELAFISVFHKGKQTEYIDERLSEDTTYRYKVRVVNEKQVESIKNSTVSMKTIGYPKNLTAISGQPEKVSLSWDAEISPEVNGYQIYISENGKDFNKLTKISSRKTNHYVDGGDWLGEKKKSGTNYYYQISTLGPKGYETVEAPIISAQTKKLPLPPKKLKYKVMRNKEKKTTTVRISWEKSTTRDIEKYRIFRKGSDDKNHSKRGEVGSLASFYDDERVKEGQTYEYTVQSIDKDGLESVFSLSATVTP